MKQRGTDAALDYATAEMRAGRHVTAEYLTHEYGIAKFSAERIIRDAQDRSWPTDMPELPRPAADAPVRHRGRYVRPHEIAAGLAQERGDRQAASLPRKRERW